MADSDTRLTSAPFNSREPRRLNKVCGRVLLAGSRSGIPDLIVTAADQGSGSARLGSAVTDDEGYFEIHYDDVYLGPTGVGRRPDLSIEVSAPEGSGSGGDVLATPKLRSSAGRTEQFVVHVAVSDLVKHRLPVPGDVSAEEDAQFNAAAVAARIERRASRRVEFKRIVQKVLAAHDTIKQGTEKDRPALTRALSQVPKPLRSRTGFVEAGSAVAPVARKVVETGTAAAVKLKRSARIALSGKQRLAIKDASRGVGALPIAELRSLLTPGPLTTAWLGEPSAALECRREAQSNDRCTDLLDGRSRTRAVDDTDTNEEIDDGIDDENDGEFDDLSAPAASGLIPNTAEALVIRALEALLDGLEGPNRMPTLQLPERPTEDTLTGALEVRSGPADVPAFHDFSVLQFAFEHVWQELLDGDVVAKVEELREQIANLGGDTPGTLAAHAIDSPSDFFDFLRRHGRRMLEVLGTHQELSLNGAPPAFLYKPIEGTDTPPLGRRRPSVKDFSGAEQIKSNDDIAKLKGLLDELTDALREPYSFTVYGADDTGFAVNFGIVLTYRQKWEPLTYQTGELVGTVTLAPNEDREVTTKRTVKKKRQDKELKNALENHTDSSNETDRAETEILRKADNKTNFNITADGSYNFGIASGDSKSAFTKDAETASADAKKDFREAVIKAANEYKSERRLEITTEASQEDEITQKNVIKNENDELTVTYLYYELQRRYRVSERLHRVLPVVMVAQRVPKPEQVTSGFLVRHDWIIKRVLLDDSFRSALEYLSNGFAGDEGALAVLRAQWETQKRVVQNLQEELSLLRHDAQDRYIHLERSIKKRVDTVAKRFVTTKMRQMFFEFTEA